MNVIVGPPLLGDLAPEGLPPSASRRAVLGVLPALGALFKKVEVLYDHRSGALFCSDSQDLGDGGPQVAVASGGTEPSQLQRDS